jgi:tRNA nucleotidyltransferase (CCA-adding enzyme)
MNNFFHYFLEGILTERPSQVIAAADAAGILPPELTALKGRPQPPQYHPEGDAFIHTCLAADRAYELDGSMVDIWATLLHDLGKAVTPDDNLPHHYNHEALGVPLVHQLCHRLDVPEDFEIVAALAAREHLNIHKFLELRPVKKVDLIDRIGEYIPNVALVAQADAQGRGPTLVDKPYPQRQAIIEAADIIGRIGYFGIMTVMGSCEKAAEKTRRERAKAIQGKFGK